jgi:DinB superfamily
MKQFLDSPNFLQTITEEVHHNSSKAQKLVDGLRDDQMSWTVAPGTWSIAQCLDHLAVTSREFDSYFTEAIQRGQEKWPVNAAIPYKPTWMGGWLIKQIVPEATRKFGAPKVFKPSQSPLIEDALGKFLKQQDRFIGFVTKTNGIDYNRTRLRSPVTPLMRYSIADAFVITVVHGWRHLGQMKRVLDTAGFPD